MEDMKVIVLAESNIQPDSFVINSSSGNDELFSIKLAKFCANDISSIFTLPHVIVANNALSPSDKLEIELPFTVKDPEFKEIAVVLLDVPEDSPE